MLIWYFIWYVFGTTKITIINNTKEPITQVGLSRFTFFPQENQTFLTKALLPDQSVHFKIPHFEGGIIRLSYLTDKTSFCRYFENTASIPHPENTIFIEPNQYIGFKSPHDPREYERDLAYQSQGSCPINDSNMQKRGFQSVQPIMVAPEPLPKQTESVIISKSDFLDATEKEIRKHWHPYMYRKKLSASILFIVSQKGQIIKIKLVRPSEEKEFDEHCLLALLAISSLSLPIEDPAQKNSYPVALLAHFCQTLSMLSVTVEKV